MKTYDKFIAEATATKKKPSLSYAEKFKKLRGDLAKSKDITAQVAAGDHGGSWILTGHDSDDTLSSETIRKAKDKVFGKRQGDSHLLFFHKHHGIVTHPAVGQVTHQDIHANPRHLRHHINQGIRARVSGMEKADVMAQGRIEHHKRGGGMISVAGRSPEGDDAPVHPSVIRSLRRAYPKHFIHDGHGNELHEETNKRAKNSFKKKWNKLLDSPEWQKAPANTSQWQLTGHNPGTKHGTTHEIEKAKERVFGKRRGKTDLMWLHFHHGVVTHPAEGDIVHTDVEENRKRKGVKVHQETSSKVREGGIGSRWGVGRIEHHEGGGGHITYHHRGGVSRDAAVRMISRHYPKYQIHDGQGNLLENWSYAHDFHSMPEDEKKKYVYHVTTAARAAKIVKGGLKPRTAKGRTNYPDITQHTKGKAFITNHHGVRYWVDQTAHAVGRRKREVDEGDYENIHVLKHPIANLKKSTRRKLRTDDIGTKDSRRNSDIIGPSSHEAPHAMFVTKNIGGKQPKRKPRRIAEGKLDFKNFLIEQNMDMVNNFIDFAAERLGLNGTPTVSFVDKKDENMSTACYDPTDRSIRILKGTRATFDVCRSIAHEMVHQLQHERGDELDGTTGSPCEDEANALAGRLIRMYAQDNPMFYEE